MSDSPRWFVVMLPGESADLSELFGPYRNETLADEACATWNTANATDDDRASVLPIHPANDLRNTR